MTSFVCQRTASLELQSLTGPSPCKSQPVLLNNLYHFQKMCQRPKRDSLFSAQHWALLTLHLLQLEWALRQQTLVGTPSRAYK